MADTRAEVGRRLGLGEPAAHLRTIKFAVCLALATSIALLPAWEGLSLAAQRSFFILCLAGLCWILEALPAFAVGLLVIGLQVLLLGRPGGVYAEGPNDWEQFVRPMASPVVWLFFGGFVMAEAAHKTQLDRHFTMRFLRTVGGRPGVVLAGVMALAFLFSMFISNTATTAMLLAVLAPLIARMPDDEPYARGLLLAVPLAANLGGMATLIGTPPNAIAAGALATVEPINFAYWMLVGMPPALMLLALVWFYLRRRYPCGRESIEVPVEEPGEEAAPPWQRQTVLGGFVVTIVLWITSPLHGAPTAVVAFLPITLFTVTGILVPKDIRSLQWDVLLLLGGGLSLGVAVSGTGLADWLVGHLPTSGLSKLGLSMVLAYIACALSNFMSNTAAANILVPIGVALGAPAAASLVAPIALGASVAMCLPVSTPPNAIAYASGKLEARDFLGSGLLVGLVGPGLAAVWCFVLFG